MKLTELDYPRRTLQATLPEGSGGVASFPGVYEGPVVAEASNVFAEGGRTSAVRPPGTDPFEIKVTLGATGTVRGHFVMPDGVTPIPFGIVRLIASGQVVGQVTTAGSGDVGTFEFQHVPAGSVRVEAQDPLTARTGVRSGELGLEQVLDLLVRAQGLGRVQGARHQQRRSRGRRHGRGALRLLPCQHLHRCRRLLPHRGRARGPGGGDGQLRQRAPPGIQVRAAERSTGRP